ncbi:50S ribosomal protein L35, chloroplastic [Amaranthus tricolor]|uniref:50S ribosomal protein L35, chloroplastic n=1 Tax=Amaranthus tricolor TaxID=29722 RepID=UPI0025882092|nr:50S ribosomal protein L35, chloroplastic [Amaranthus tricolor]
MAMASSTPILSLNPVSFQASHLTRGSFSLSHFTKHFNNTLKLTSCHNIAPSKLLPVPFQKRNLVIDSSSSSSTSFTVVAAKGYKMKTHKASAKRFRVTGKGKIVRRRAGKQHLLAKKSTKRKNRLSKVVQVDRSDYDNVIGALPYLKVNRKV